MRTDLLLHRPLWLDSIQKIILLRCGTGRAGNTAAVRCGARVRGGQLRGFKDGVSSFWWVVAIVNSVISWVWGEDVCHEGEAVKERRKNNESGGQALI